MKSSFTKEEFINWTTKGYPLKLECEVEEFMIMFAHYVNNNTSSSNFIGYITEDYKEVHMTYDNNLILTVAYDVEDNKVIMLTGINEETSDRYSKDLNEFEVKKCLGEACIGVIVFCSGIKEIQDLREKVPPIVNQIGEMNKPIFSERSLDKYKYDVWPLK